MRRTWSIPVTATLSQFIHEVEQRVALCVQSRTLGEDGRPVRRERELCRANASLIRVYDEARAQDPPIATVTVVADFRLVNGRVEEIVFSARFLRRPFPDSPDPEADMPPLRYRPRPVPVPRIRNFMDGLSLIRSRVQREQLVEVGVDSVFSDPGPNTIGGPSRHQRQTTPAWVGLDWATDELQRMIDNPRMRWPEQIDVFRRALDALSNEACNWRSGNRGIGGVRNLSDLETLRTDMVEFFRSHYGQRYTPPRCNPHPNAAAGRLLDRIFEHLPRPDTRRPQGADAAGSR
jgi:hypothetical protein